MANICVKYKRSRLMFTLPLHRVLGESLGILFVGFIRDLASAALLSLRTKVEHRAMGHTAMRRDTGNSLPCSWNSGKFPSEGLNMFIATVCWGHLLQTEGSLWKSRAVLG